MEAAGGLAGILRRMTPVYGGTAYLPSRSAAADRQPFGRPSQAAVARRRAHQQPGRVHGRFSDIWEAFGESLSSKLPKTPFCIRQMTFLGNVCSRLNLNIKTT